MASLQAESIIVTGAASGIGRACATLLGQDGARLTLVDRDQVAGEQICDEIKASGGTAQFFHGDVADHGSVQSSIGAATDAFGPLYGAVNCAGIAPSGRAFQELFPEDFDRVMAVNLRGVFLSVRYQLEEMLRGGRGSVVVMSSTAALRALPCSAEYNISKAAINALVRSAAIDCGGRGVRINALLPGPTWTPMTAKAMAAMSGLEGVTAALPMKRFADPVEIARAAVWLLSDDASYVHGACLPIDGGQSA